MRLREVIHPPLWLLGIIYLFLLTLVVSLWAALGNNAALISLVLVTSALVWIYYATALRIEVTETELRVGKAHIDLTFIGDCVDLDNDAIRRVRTRDADPLAYLAIRFWVSKGVQVRINDDRDPTPYWLISTKGGAELIQAIKS